MKERIVVKVGTPALTNNYGKIDLLNMEHLVQVLSDIMARDLDVVLVTSAAITVGYEKMGLVSRPANLNYAQAAAAVGQYELMHLYDKFFHEHGRVVAQVLLDEEDMRNAKRRKSLYRTLSTLLSSGIIPIVNENDSVSYKEIESPEKRFGDNDLLSAHVALLLGASKLILLSDIYGLYEQDPQDKDSMALIHEVPCVDARILQLAEEIEAERAEGGIVTKLRAAELVTPHGCEMFIINGSYPTLIYSALAGIPAGTRFVARQGMDTRVVGEAAPEESHMST